MTKRKFAVDTTALSTVVPVLETGIYAGQITSAGVKFKDNKWGVNIEQEQSWDDDLQKFVVEPNAPWIIRGNFNYGVVLTSKKAIKLLQRNEPIVFGQIRLSYDPETYIMRDNVALGKLIEVCGFKDHDFDAEVDWEYDESIEIPEALASVPNAVDLVNALDYTRQLLTKIAESINHTPVRVNIERRPKRKAKEEFENVIYAGTWDSPSCGLLPYVEGCEEDLDA